MKNLLTRPNEFDEDTKEEIKRREDPWDWENYCGNCDWFGDEKRCPFYNLVKNSPETRWKDIGCENFWD